MINQGMILGRVGKIETKTTNSGTKVTNCSLVTSKKVTRNGEKEEKITWHNVTMFNKIAEIAEKYVAVGDLLYVQGEMDTQKYTTQDGQQKTKSFLIAHELKLMPKAREHKPETKTESLSNEVDDDDIPW